MMRHEYQSVKPEIVVGIDFGMTCTGVAYSMAPDWGRPTTIQHWPGKLGHQNRNKVDTVVAYDENNRSVRSWGFLVDKTNRSLNIQTHFKLYLDTAHHDGFREAPPVHEARRWFVDYLRCIYRAIESHFSETHASWTNKDIEFTFSVPTTWRNPATIGEIERLIHQAGFGQRKNHSIVISLTEAEAAAAYVAKQQYQPGEVFMVCDAGGGTTDINTLKVVRNTSGQTILEPLDHVEGEAIGSSLIDYKMEQRIREQLEGIRHSLAGEPAKIAEEMVTSNDRFETFKCSFGSEALQHLELRLPVPGLESGRDFPAANVWNSVMVIPKQDLQKTFDEQIARIFNLLDSQFRKLEHEQPREQISYLVLSGGLGSSPYVKQRLRHRYETGVTNLPNATDLKILTAVEPQLAVVHGLVIHRSQELKEGEAVYRERCCRNSYGVIVRAPYSPLEHLDEDVTIDPRDKMKWAERQIHWFIRQGERVPIAEPITKHYRMKINLAAYLPKSMKGEGVKVVCEVEALINNKDMKLKNRHWYNFGEQYFLAEFDLKVMIGAADLKFQIWGRDKQLSRNHDQINVQWNPPSEARQSMASTSGSGMHGW